MGDVIFGIITIIRQIWKFFIVWSLAFAISPNLNCVRLCVLFNGFWPSCKSFNYFRIIIIIVGIPCQMTQEKMTGATHTPHSICHHIEIKTKIINFKALSINHHFKSSWVFDDWHRRINWSIKSATNVTKLLFHSEFICKKA